MKCPYVIIKCKGCGELLVACKKNFYAKKGGKYGLRTKCKRCMNTANKENSDAYYQRRKDIVKGNCLYMLKDNNKIVYIGKSTALGVRLHEHKKDKKFNKVYYIKFNNRTNMELAEIYFIYKYKPRLNREFLHYKDEEVISIKEFDSMKWSKLDKKILDKI